MRDNIDLRVAGYQMPVGLDIGHNVQKICTGIDQAAAGGAEILLTPEGSLSGYTHEFDAAAVASALEDVTAKARAKGIGLALGTCFLEQDGRCYNQLRFYRPDGQYLGFHSKTLRCGTLEPTPRGEINNYAVAPLQIFNWSPDLKIGGLICNDLWANPGCTPMPDPHLTRQLADLDATIIFHAVNGGRNGSSLSELAWQYHKSNLRMRARAGNIWIVTVDNATPEDLPCSAPSGVIDPAGDFVLRTKSKGAQFFVRTLTLTRGQQRNG